MDTGRLFYEDEHDAIRVAIQAIGGNKKAAELLWGVNYKGGDQRIRDCLNPNRDEKFSFREVILLSRTARDSGCHALAVYFNAEAGYAPPVPITKEDEKAELDRQVVEAISGLRGLLDRAERFTAKTTVR
jgi:hypothetical protein